MHTQLLGWILSLIACDGAGPVEDRNLAEGLTVFEARNGVLTVAFRRGSDIVFLEALRGNRAPAEVVAADPQAPAYEVDARAKDAEGMVFYSRKGGDEWVDPEWEADAERAWTQTPGAQGNRSSFELLAEASGALRDGLGDGAHQDVGPELEALISFGRRAVHIYDEELDRARGRQRDPSSAIVDDGSGRAIVDFGSKEGPEDGEVYFGEQGYYYIAVHEAGIDATLGIGRHSATAKYRWANNAWLFFHENCNHGRCATVMGRYCLLQYYEPIVDFHVPWTNQSCSTPYSLTSDGGGHNCHDDTRLQLNNFVYARYRPRTGFWCNGADDASDISHWTLGDESGAPDCNGRSAKGYHHPSMCLWNHNRSCPDSWRNDRECDCGCTFSDGTAADPDCA
ncbi:MAG: hypothetical protein NZ898_04635 [Myxococcota bacterium]|nr:hypothetical protein [Myxococcota bacterium]MDW8362021.1 hypothetical protein [Myxococcales bacterium]